MPFRKFPELLRQDRFLFRAEQAIDNTKPKTFPVFHDLVLGMKEAKITPFPDHEVLTGKIKFGVLRWEADLAMKIRKDGIVEIALNHPYESIGRRIFLQKKGIDASIGAGKPATYTQRLWDKAAQRKLDKIGEQVSELIEKGVKRA